MRRWKMLSLNIEWTTLVSHGFVMKCKLLKSSINQ